ncbi:MAG: class I SAM-dependent methyltransferase [Desulfurococcaceae archaeon]
MIRLVKPSVYDELYKDEQFEKYNCLVQLVGEPRGDLLDAGCGTALLYEYFEIKNYRVKRYICLDPDEEILIEALKKLVKEPRALIILGYAEKLPLRSGVFDYALSISTWGAIEEKGKALHELKRVINEKGVAVITGHPRTYKVLPSDLDQEYSFKLNCVDDFYIYKPQVKPVDARNSLS